MDQRTQTVLVVDDDITTRFLAREALELQGFGVHEVGDGAAAVAAVDDACPDFILMDVVMPEMDGFTACSRIRDMPAGRHVPILMMTGLDDIESINRAYQVGATDFTTKPINFALLGHRIRYMLRAKQTADELRASEARLANAQRIAKLCHWDWDLDQTGIRWSEGIVDILGLSSSQPVDTFDSMLQRVSQDDRQVVIDAVDRARRKQRGFSIEYQIRGPGERLLTVRQEAEFLASGANGSGRLIGTMQDISERRSAESRIKQLAYYDAVTGLPNRALLAKELRQKVADAKQMQQGLAVISLELDNFQPINDTFGYNKANQVLRDVAEWLGGSLARHTEVGEDQDGHGRSSIAHLGGEQFVILLMDISSAEEVVVIAGRLREVVSRPFQMGENEIRLSCSLGISLFPEDGKAADTLLKHSGTALYSAKRAGGNRNKFFKAAMNTRAVERLSMESDLRKAFQRHQFVLYFQPKVAVADGQVVGMEAMLRWQKSDGEIVYPGRFIPIAEDIGMIGDLGEYTLQMACDQLMAWRARGLPPLQIAVNVSAMQFRQKDLLTRFADLIKNAHVDPRLLAVEITESILMTNMESVIETMNGLKALGIDISIDDFGTGYSSLSYLRRLPIDVLKVDQSFIRDVTTDNDAAAIVEAIIAMAHSLRLKVIAEGVEHQSQQRFLERFGCDEMQGFYFSQPLPADEFVAWLRKYDTDAVA